MIVVSALLAVIEGTVSQPSLPDDTHDLVPKFSSVRHLEFGSLIRSRLIFLIIHVEAVAILHFWSWYCFSVP